MANNQVSVEITLEEKAALKALTQLTKHIQTTEDSFTKMGNASSKSIKEAEAAFKKGLTSISTSTKATSQDLKDYEERTRKAKEEAAGFFGQVKDGSSSAFGQMVKGVAIANLASTAIIGTANAVKDFVFGSINAAVEQENAINRLNQSLKASGDFSDRASQDFLDFASSMQQVSIYGDEVVIGQVAVAKSFGATNEQAKQLVEAAANLSATFGGSLESNVEKLGKTFSGQAGRLAQYIPELKGLTEEQLKAGDAFEIVNNKFSGAAANELNTYGGKVTSAANAFSDLQEEMGRFVIENGYVGAAIDIAKTSFLGLIAAQRAANELFGLAGTKAQEQRKEMSALGEEYNKLTENIRSLSGMREASVKFGTGEESNLARIKELTDAIAGAEARKNQILIERKNLRVADIADKQAQEQSENKVKTVDGGAKEDARVLKEQQVQIEIARIKEESRIASEEQNALIYEASIGKRELEIEEIYAFEMQKLEATFKAEEQKAELIKNSTERNSKIQELSAKKELETTRLYNNQLKSEQQRKIKDQEATNAALIVTASNFLGAGQLLAKEGSNAQKALQVTQATISTYTAATNALAQPVPYPVALAMSASMIALGLANVAKISGAKFEQGGIVGGNSMTGDNINARVNSGEMILNRQQQTSLFNQINSGQNGGQNSDQIERLIEAINNQTMVLAVDGRAIATVVRKEVQGGFKIA